MTDRCYNDMFQEDKYLKYDLCEGDLLHAENAAVGNFLAVLIH